MRTLNILVLLIVLGSSAGASAQDHYINIPVPTFFSYPVQVTANKITIVLVGFSTASVVLLDGIPLPTSKVDWQTIVSHIPVTTTKGNHRIEVRDVNGLVSNEDDIIVGSGAKTRACVGGLIPFISVPQVELYRATYNTLDCYFLEPPPRPFTY